MQSKPTEDQNLFEIASTLGPHRSTSGRYLVHIGTQSGSSVHLSVWNAADGSVESEVLACCELVEEGIELRAESQMPSRCVELGAHAVATERRGARSWTECAC